MKVAAENAEEGPLFGHDQQEMKKLKEQIDVIREQQWEVSWRNYIHEEFKDSDKAGTRRKYVVLDLDQTGRPTSRAKIKELSARVATAYAGLDDKTLSRDLAWLEKRQFIRNDAKGYVSNRELILAFLPHCVATGIEPQKQS